MQQQSVARGRCSEQDTQVLTRCLRVGLLTNPANAAVQEMVGVEDLEDLKLYRLQKHTQPHEVWRQGPGKAAVRSGQVAGVEGVDRGEHGFGMVEGEGAGVATRKGGTG